MKINKLTTELMVDDMKKSINFYKEIFDFDVTTSVPEKNPFFVVLKNDSIELMLYQTDYGTTEFSFEDCNGYVLMLSEKK